MLTSTLPPTATRPALNPADIRVTADQMGRAVVVIPTDTARRMQHEIKTGWREIPDVGDGYSRKFPQGSWMYEATAAMMAAFAASPVPEGSPDYAQRDRNLAAQGYSLYAFVVGEDGWDDEARWWRDYEATKDLHLSGSPVRTTLNRQPAVYYGG